MTLAALPPAIAQAVVAQASAHQVRLGSVRCWLTHSENPPATGFFGKLLGRRANSVDPDAEHDSVLVLHATHLFVATSGVHRGTSVLSLPLEHTSMTRGSGLRSRLGEPDVSGLTLSGFPGEPGSPGTYFFGLGPEPAATECVQAVEAAIIGAKNPG